MLDISTAPHYNHAVMKIQEDCRPCLIRQMESTARITGLDEISVQEVVREAEKKLGEIWDTHLSPPEISAPLYRMTGTMCQSSDPWLPRKIQYTREALKLLPTVMSMVENAPDPFEAAVRISIAGNVIDFGTGRSADSGIDIDDAVRKYLDQEIFINDMRPLRQAGAAAGTILFIGDNAGETVLDRPLLSMLKKDRLVYAARGGAIINDATIQDAVLAGIGLHAEVVSTGTTIPGTIPAKCSREFQQLFLEADLIISKGQGNFETLSELPREGRIFMLFVIKCSLAARQIGGEVGDMVVMKW